MCLLVARRPRCSKTCVMFVWGMLECLFFSGLLSGSHFVKDALQSDGFFRKVCCSLDNTTISHEPAGSNVPNFNSSLTTTAGQDGSSVTTRTFTGETLAVSMDNRPTQHTIRMQQNLPPRPTAYNSALENMTRYAQCRRCQSDALALVFDVSNCVAKVLLLPVGCMFDLYGTLKVRLVAM